MNHQWRHYRGAVLLWHLALRNPVCVNFDRGFQRAVQVAESVGAAGKLTGSGGAVVVLCPKGGDQEQLLQEACVREGWEYVRAVPGPVNVVAS